MDVNKNNNQGEIPECIETKESERKGIISKSINGLCALSVAATMYIVDPKSSYADTQGVDNSGVTSTLVSGEKSSNERELTSKEIFTQLQEIGVSPDKLEGSIIRDVSESDEVAQTPMLKSDLFGEGLYTVDNIISRLEETARLMNEKYNSQYKPGDWTEAMKLVRPLEEEVYMLMNFVDSLPAEIEKPLDAWQAMVGLLSHDRRDILPENELIDFVLLADAYKVLRVVRPDLVNDAVVVELGEEYDRKTYTIVQPTAENMFALNSFLRNKIPKEKIIGFEVEYARIMEEAKKEYAFNFKSKQIEKGVPSERLDRVMPRILEVFEAEMLEILEGDDNFVSEPRINNYRDYIRQTALTHFSSLPGNFDFIYITFKEEEIKELHKGLKEALQKLGQSV